MSAVVGAAFAPSRGVVTYGAPSYAAPPGTGRTVSNGAVDVVTYGAPGYVAAQAYGAPPVTAPPVPIAAAVPTAVVPATANIRAPQPVATTVLTVAPQTMVAPPQQVYMAPPQTIVTTQAAPAPQPVMVERVATKVTSAIEPARVFVERKMPEQPKISWERVVSERPISREELFQTGNLLEAPAQMAQANREIARPRMEALPATYSAPEALYTAPSVATVAAPSIRPLPAPTVAIAPSAVAPATVVTAPATSAATMYTAPTVATSAAPVYSAPTVQTYAAPIAATYAAAPVPTYSLGMSPVPLSPARATRDFSYDGVYSQASALGAVDYYGRGGYLADGPVAVI